MRDDLVSCRKIALAVGQMQILPLMPCSLMVKTAVAFQKWGNHLTNSNPPLSSLNSYAKCYGIYKLEIALKKIERERVYKSVCSQRLCWVFGFILQIPPRLLPYPTRSNSYKALVVDHNWVREKRILCTEPTKYLFIISADISSIPKCISWICSHSRGQRRCTYQFLNI